MCRTGAILTVISLKLSLVLSAPLLQFLDPYQRIAMEPSQQNLQQQLMELQTMQQFNSMPQFGMNQLQPFIILLPDQPINTNMDINPEVNDRIENKLNLNIHKTKNEAEEEEDLDSVVIDAEPMPILEEQKAYLVLPNGRFSIGGIISAIPFLPIEINVPDAISWAYNGISSGISGIISIIGSRLPFKRPTEVASMKNVNLKSVANQLGMQSMNNVRPLVIMPLDGLSRPLFIL